MEGKIVKLKPSEAQFIREQIEGEDFYHAFIDGWAVTREPIKNKELTRLRNQFLSATKALANFVGYKGFKGVK